MDENIKPNKKKLFITIGIILVIIIIIAIMVIRMNNERAEAKKNMSVVKDTYSDLTKNVAEYNELRTNLTKKLESFYYETYQKEHNDYLTILSSYNDNIKKIDKNISDLDSRCQVIYTEPDVNSMCKNYKVIYEKLVNLYVNDLNNYNYIVREYNEYKEENISQYTMIHEYYIDYNKDDKYEGREVNNEETKETNN